MERPACQRLPMLVKDSSEHRPGSTGLFARGPFPKAASALARFWPMRAKASGRLSEPQLGQERSARERPRVLTGRCWGPSLGSCLRSYTRWLVKLAAQAMEK